MKGGQIECTKCGETSKHGPATCVARHKKALKLQKTGNGYHFGSGSEREIIGLSMCANCDIGRASLQAVGEAGIIIRRGRPKGGVCED